MNDIFDEYSNFTIIYIDDILIYSSFIEQHFKHLNTFINVIKKNGLVISTFKITLFKTNIRFLGHEIQRETIKPIQRSISFTSKFSDEIKNKNQLQRFLGSLNYIQDHIPNLHIICKPLY